MSAGVRRTIPAVMFAAALWAGGASGASHDANGTLLFATGGDGVSDRLELAAVNPDGSGFRKLTHLPAPGLAPRWSADGRKIVFITEDTFTLGVANWRMRADGTHRRRLPGVAGDVPSPNGDLVQIYDRIVDANGKVVRRIRPGLRRNDWYGGPPLWSPDGRYITINVLTETQNSEYNWVDVVPTSGLGRGRVITARGEGHFAGALSWSRDSRRMLLDISHGRGDDWYAVAPDGSERRHVLHMPTGEYRDHAWAPDSRRIAYVGPKGGIFIVSAWGGRSRRVVATKSRRADAYRIYLDWSSRGEIVFSDVGGTYVVRADGRGLRRLTRRRGAPYWSPNGRTVVLSESNEIYLVFRGGGERQLTRWIRDSDPQWSPDARRIAFVRVRSSQPPRVYAMNADGTGQRALGAGVRPRWSPDGSKVAFVEVRPPPDNDRIFVSNVDGDDPRAMADGEAPTWSPDGRIAFMRYEYVLEDQGHERQDWSIAKSTLLTVHTDGSDVRVLAEFGRYEGGGAFAPRWSPDGRTIALLLRDDNGEGGVLLVDTVDGTVRVLTDATPESIEWSPDGRRILARYWVRLWLIDAATGTTTKIREEGKDESSLDGATWSPDGSTIAFILCTFDDSVCDVYAMEAETGAQQRRLTRTPGIETGLDWAG